MKKSLLFLTVIGSVIAIVFFVYQGTINGLLNAERHVNTQWGNVEKQYQLRANLVSNLVDTVKVYAGNELSSLKNVIEARANATQITIDPSFLNEHTIAQFLQTQNELESAINNLLICAEAYPAFKACPFFLDLQKKLKENENRIITESTLFNKASKEYNQLILAFPGNIIADVENFIQKPYFTNKTL